MTLDCTIEEAKEPASVVTLTLRIPKPVYSKLSSIKSHRPHMSLNAIIIDAIARSSPDTEPVGQDAEVQP